MDFSRILESDVYGGLEGVDTAHLSYLDKALNGLWGLGRNIILQWTPRDAGIDVLVIPHYLLSEYVAKNDLQQTDPSDFLSEIDDRSRQVGGLIQDVISGPKMTSGYELEHLASVLGYPLEHVELPFIPGDNVSTEIIEALIKRYSISYIEDRAVALFDIVGFSLFSTLDQVTQLNSLAYSMNHAHSKMLANNININFARSTTGDGFYIWNRDRSIQANINLYHFMHLVLADNAIARSKSANNTTPLLRTCFHVGGHYEFYQAEGIDPTVYSYIVGDVTIELARMIEQAKPGQVLVGDFWVPMPDRETNQIVKTDSLKFIDKAQATLSSLQGLELADERIESIKCYLTGDKMAEDKFGVRKYAITDKHRKVRNVYNAKVNIYRGDAEPIFLGLQTSELEDFASVGIEFVIPD